MNESVRAVVSEQRLRQLLAAGSLATEANELLALGADLHRSGNLESALAAFEAAAKTGVPQAALWNAIATLRFSLKRPQAALAACNEALRQAPDAPDSLFNTAVALEAIGDRQAAVHCYRRALNSDSAHRGALLNLVPLLLAEKQFAEALHLSESALAHHAGDADCRFNHGEVMTSLNRHADALAAYEQALALRPQWGKADIAAAVAMAALGQLAPAGRRLSAVGARDPDALITFRSPLETDRESRYPELEPGRIALIAAYQRHRVCDWSNREAFVSLFHSVVDGEQCKPLDNPDLPFLGMGLPLSPEYRRRMAVQVAGRIEREAAKTPVVRAAVRKPGPLRVGYLSGDFRRHATAWLMRRLPALHDRSRFESVLYSTGPDDGSEIRAEISAASDHFCDARHFDDAALAQRIAMDRIDILVDLSGYTLHSRPAVLAMRPAPLQLSYLVYLQTSGSRWIDYVLLDRQVLTAAERACWTEKIAYLPHTLYLCDDRAEMGESQTTRNEEGLPEDAFVYCCLNAPWKIDPETFASWMAILRRVPNAVFWLYADIEGGENNLRAAARDAGVDDKRLFFARSVAHEQHLARFCHADAFLDTFSCNAHTTAIEALAAGVPVVSLPGETVVARVGLSLLAAHGLQALVARSAADYVEIACRLAEEPCWHESMRALVRRKEGSHLFCTRQRVREIESAFEMIWARHVSALPPSDLDVTVIDHPAT
jgi:predicted O-linked N-acetylglucosamine transferase (SPINDLY family)